jgi:hypothetical protein
MVGSTRLLLNVTLRLSLPYPGVSAIVTRQSPGARWKNAAAAVTHYSGRARLLRGDAVLLVQLSGRRTHAMTPPRPPHRQTTLPLRRALLLRLVVALGMAVPVAAQPAVPRYEVRRTAAPPTIDGRLDEAAWAAAPAVTLQMRAENGKYGHTRTNIRPQSRSRR